MSCEMHTMKDGTRLILCSRGRQERVKCAFCGRPATFYCDYSIGNGKTCDKPICRKCRTAIGVELDVCPHHTKETGLFGDGAAMQFEGVKE